MQKIPGTHLGRTASGFLIALIAAAGCNEILGFEQGDLDPGTTSSTTGTTAASTTGGETTSTTSSATTGTGGAGGQGGEGGQGGSAPPIPTDGLLFWFDASQGVTEIGGAVSEWQDLSGNDYHATQPTTLWQPYVGPLGPSQGIIFDGDNDYLALPTINGNFSEGLSIFSVFSNATPADPCPPIFQLSNGEEVDDIDIHTDTAALAYEIFDTYFSGSTTVSTDEVMLMSVLHVPNEAEVRKNSQVLVTQAILLPVNIERSQNFIGDGLYGSCDHWHGSIGEIIVYDRPVLAPELAQIEGYLKAKFGLP